MGPERKLSKKVVEWARKQYAGTLIVIKLEAGRYGTVGWPDYMFLMIDGGVFFIEFKAPGAHPTALQTQRHKELRAIKHRVYVIDREEEGKNVISHEMNGRRRVA